MGFTKDNGGLPKGRARGSRPKVRRRTAQGTAGETDDSNAASGGEPANSNSTSGTEQTRNNETSGSTGKIQAFLGIVALTLGNIAAIITHVDELRQLVSKVLGTEWVYRFHVYIVYGGCALFLLGYGGLTYWLYRNFVAQKPRWIRAGFYVAASVAVGSMVLGSYAFLFRSVDVAPLVKKQLAGFAQVVLSQQVGSGENSGGFRFSQSGISDDAQVWTTAQCLMALLQQDVAIVKEAGFRIRQAFEYVEHSRLKPPNEGEGWGYQTKSKWGVTEIDAWVALAYIYSLRPDNSSIVWKSEELSETIAKTNFILDMLMKRQHDDGSWAPIEKTSNPKHERTYSTIMAVWALAEAAQNGDVSKGHETDYRAALTLGAKWLLNSYTPSVEGFWGWWPNPSARNPVGAYPALTAQALFILSKANASAPFIGADSRYKTAVETLIGFAFDGNAGLEPLTKRKIGNNEQARDSDRYLEGRDETAEQSTFLWYPWVIAMATSLEHNPILMEYQHKRLRDLLLMLLERADEENAFVRNDEVIYPTAELLFAEGYYFSRDGLLAQQK